ncbi:hypothetical protein CHCC20488_3644 [Bacillus paralicheniformis]|nr:hypothetical protein [Bacillus paralicheniformis]AGN38326.1 hypothetical protein BaLi_c40140 [Bacillus paralicheniformis ATCC 9945a]AJO20417.1 hypothetical protein SC10_B2orf06034 [Bacillus paralicheniformis]OLF95977.1 hypothetical protein B4121_1539 [Bacillus paralicheniformis]OLG05044.1 hypothetical protein B4125_3116 [Bacillus paralicheniformis]TWJ43774.1 hypothetical protein CHCC5027_1931 [Bacillus paralicheniformis]
MEKKQGDFKFKRRWSCFNNVNNVQPDTPFVNKNQENEEKECGRVFCPLLKNSEENQEEQRLVKFYYFAFLLKI